MLEAHAPGYRSQRVKVVPDADKTITMRLAKLAP